LYLADSDVGMNNSHYTHVRQLYQHVYTVCFDPPR